MWPEGYKLSAFYRRDSLKRMNSPSSSNELAILELHRGSPLDTP